MFGIPGTGNGLSLNNLLSAAAQVGLGAMTGGASLAVTTALKGVMMAVGDQIIAQVGQQLGLPPAVIDMAQAAFHAEAGDMGGAVQDIGKAAQDLGQAAGADNFQTGQLQQQAQQGADEAANQALAQMQTDGMKQSGGSNDIAAATKGKSLLVAMAIAMGSVADNKMKEMYNDTQKLANLKAGDKGYAQLTGEVQGLGQEIGLITNALNNAIKSIGDGASTLARKG